LLLAAGWRAAVGLLLLALGVGLIGWSVAAAADRRVDSPAELITQGPYLLSRNPMYLGWTLLHISLGLLANSCWIILLALPASIVTHFLDVRREEQFLERKFGAEHLRYKQRVRRYL
jgi:protein-S-isoprenylcysteine O-methyltransferase Ste14